MRRWMQVDVLTDEAGALRAQVSASSGGRQTPPRPMPGVNRAQMEAFGRSVRRAGDRGADLSAELRDWAHTLYGAVFGGEIGQVADLLRGEQGRLLVRLMVSEPALRGAPWEAMRGPTATDGPVATSATLQFVRGVYSTEPAVAREVRGALRVLAVTPADMAASVEDLAAELAPAVAAGQIEWLPPCVGVAARWPHLLRRLQESPQPHALHIVCHGRVQDGRPELLLDPDEGRWLPVEVLASALVATGCQDLRLIYLESCSGAEPGALASAAELLATRGVEAVVAHLWPVRASAARTLANTFYTNLAGPGAGDVAASLTAARLALAGLGTAEQYGPVLVLRGENPALFDLRRRAPPVAQPRATPTSTAMDAELQRTLDVLQRCGDRPHSLVVGDLIDPQGRSMGREQLLRQLSSYAPEGERGSLAALMQRYELHEEREELRAVVQEVLDTIGAGDAEGPPELIDLLARLARPGLSLTLLWLPLLEEAIGFHHPDREILVCQPLRPDGLDRMRLFRRGPSETRWSRLAELPERLDFTTQHVVVRLYGGYSPMTRTLLGDPVLTEDDFLLNLADIEALPEQILAFLRHSPALVAGLTPLSWSHRELLRRLTGHQPLSSGSVAILGAAADPAEHRYWSSSRGPGGRPGAMSTVAFDEVLRLARALR